MLLAVSIVADLRNHSGTAYGDVRCMVAGGSVSVGDGGGGLFIWDRDVVTSDDGATVLVPSAAPRLGCWKRV